ncbi:MAG: hypothetical protein JST87_14010 [Bacteroidetes bacterium]|nr:hypothetical protein [Bacteroidota bacterium]
MKFFRLTFLPICLFLFCENTFCQSNQNATIIGRWLSEDDERSEIVFTQINMLSYYDKKLTSTTTYEINNDTLKATDKALNKTFFYSIETLNELHLSLMFLENGHVTLFRREN